MPATDTSEREYAEAADCAGCFAVAIAELRRRHQAGEVIERTGYFALPTAESEAAVHE